MPSMFWLSVCVCVWKHLGTGCYIFRLRIDKNKKTLAAFPNLTVLSDVKQGAIGHQANAG